MNRKLYINGSDTESDEEEEMYLDDNNPAFVDFKKNVHHRCASNYQRACYLGTFFGSTQNAKAAEAEEVRSIVIQNQSRHHHLKRDSC